MIMRISTLVLALAALAAAGFAAAETGEMSAVNVKELVTQLKQDAGIARTMSGIEIEVSCTDFVFGENSPAQSDSKTLVSRTWDETCEPIPVPGGGCIPNRRVMFTDQADVRVVIPGRATPGPVEKFRACLRAQDLRLDVVSSPNKYDVSQKDGVFTLTRKP